MGNSIDSLIFQPPTKKEIIHHEFVNHGFLNYQNKSLHYAIYYPYFTKISSGDKVMIYSHGNASDVESMHYYLLGLSRRLGIIIISYDYFGYGHSSFSSSLSSFSSLSSSEKVNPSEDLCYKSHELVIDFVINKMNISPNNIILVGQSLGTAIVVDYTFKYRWNSPIFLISPFKSIATVVSESKFVSLVDKFKTIEKIDKIQCPVKIFHGEVDTVVPIYHSYTLSKILPINSPKPTFFPNAEHNNIVNYIDWESVLLLSYISN